MTPPDPVTAALDQLAAHHERIAQLDEREAGHFAGLSGQLSETADLAFSKMQEAREAAAKAEAAWHTLRAHLANKRWFPVVERMNVKFNTTPIPRWEDQNDFPDWARFVDALGNDANAQVQL